MQGMERAERRSAQVRRRSRLMPGLLAAIRAHVQVIEVARAKTAGCG